MNRSASSNGGEALERLEVIADIFLSSDWPIVRPVYDLVVQVVHYVRNDAIAEGSGSRAYADPRSNVQRLPASRPGRPSKKHRRADGAESEIFISSAYR